MSTTLYEVVVTAIIIKDGKYLITKRSDKEKRFPGKWTVPGGRLDESDYSETTKETENYWYNVLEKALKREVLEETGVEIKNIEYITSLATVHSDGKSSLVISCSADYLSGDVKLQDETVDCKWIRLEEAKSFDLIEGIYEELIQTEEKRKGTKSEWEKSK